MAGYIGVYLHGFLSSGNSHKGLWFKAKVLQTAEENSLKSKNYLQELMTPTYQIASPQLSIEQIDQQIKLALSKIDKVVLIGSSMGGFYVRFFAHKYDLPYIMINPALNACELLTQHFGEYINPNTNEIVTVNQNYINMLADYQLKQSNPKLHSLLLIDKDDEVIDVDFALSAYEKTELNNHKTIEYSGGDHSFIHLESAWQKMGEFMGELSD